MTKTPALPAGQRGGTFPSSRLAARTPSSTTTHGTAGTTTTPTLLRRSGNSALRARKVESPELISADQLLNAKRGRVRLSPPRSTVETAGAPAPAFF